MMKTKLISSVSSFIEQFQHLGSTETPPMAPTLCIALFVIGGLLLLCRYVPTPGQK